MVDLVGRLLTTKALGIVTLIVAACTAYNSLLLSRHLNHPLAWNPPPAEPTRHILFGLSGDHPSFLSEFEVALKSLLLNVPPHNTTIHIMADELAYNALCDILFAKSQLMDWVTSYPLRIVIYNIESKQQEWVDRINKRLGFLKNMTTMSFFRHTMGAYYRLLCGEVLPKTVKRVAYLDTDVVVLANMENLWQKQHVDEKALFQWGKNRCSAFMILNPQKMEEVWDHFAKIPLEDLKKKLARWPAVDDQLVFKEVNTKFPHLVGPLPPEWDISAMNGPWKFKPTVLLKHRSERAGMLHFNGGGESKEAFFESHSFMKDPIWGLAKFYVNLPWSWARFIAESRVREGTGHKIQLKYNWSGCKNTV